MIMKHFILLLFLTLNIQAAQRYNFVTNDLTQWSDSFYIIVDGDTMTMVMPDGTVNEGTISDYGTMTIDNFILTIFYIDDEGNAQQTKFIEGIEYGNK